MRTTDEDRRARRLGAAAGWVMAVQERCMLWCFMWQRATSSTAGSTRGCGDEPIAVPADSGDMTQQAAQFWASTGSFGLPSCCSADTSCG